MDKRICEMTDFVVENGLELNVLSSDIVIKLYNDRIRRVEKFLEKFGEVPGERLRYLSRLLSTRIKTA